MTDSPWWIRASTPTGVHFYPLADLDDSDAVQAALDAVRAEHDVPESWIDVPGWDLSITSGPLAASAVASGTVHPGLPE